jgi:hypothetical protein
MPAIGDTPAGVVEVVGRLVSSANGDLDQVAILEAERIPQSNGGRNFDHSTVVVSCTGLVLVGAEDERSMSMDRAWDDVHADSSSVLRRLYPESFRRQAPVAIKYDIEASGKQTDTEDSLIGIGVLRHPAREITPTVRYVAM